MENEEELLEQLKFLISCNNDAQAIKIILQYGIFKQEEITNQCKEKT